MVSCVLAGGNGEHLYIVVSIEASLLKIELRRADHVEFFESELLGL